jgi:hypothetical protein
VTTIHHATKKRATALGVEVLGSANDQFALRNLSTDRLSRERWNSAQEAVQAMKDGLVTWEVAKRTHCGVMPFTYHDRYEHNPDGPGCGDGLDVAMRAAFSKAGADVDLVALKACGEACGLWKEAWEVRNPGMQRMNLANRIRGLLRNDIDAKVTIGAKTGRFGVAFQPASRKRKVAA